ncbi:hypothetical protein OG895_30385 [Streptomyces sp. NBC_00201]|uniref:hypothetical protein n=1 Tax=unclassified Streptomyces TaxID=2593676 RepID=UPI00224F9554|nr:hypothetical protein [Streptomyces sp. NBC_00201]MCX5249478.1 hypothetical protein [Streptomyces sp. NBC_00201]
MASRRWLSGPAQEQPEGVTGHRDHQLATSAARFVAGQAGIALLGRTLPQEVADRLNAEFGTSFTGRDPAACRVVEPMPRERQYRPVACHAGQSSDTPVLWRRLELLGDYEHLRIPE